MFRRGYVALAEDENDGITCVVGFSVQKEEEGTIPINLFRRCNLEGNSVFRKCFHVFMFPAGFQVLLCTTFTLLLLLPNYNTSSSSS